MLVHASRDKILLDQANEEDEDGDEEEVFALQGVSSDWDDDDEAGAEDEDRYEVEDDEEAGDDIHDATASKSKSKSKSSKATRGTKAPSSDKSTSDSEDEGTWGRGKGAYYSSNAAQLDSEDEEANELEEQEVLRLQAKACESMCDLDFGLGDIVEGDSEPPEATYARRLPCTWLLSLHVLGNNLKYPIQVW